jgi:hypothetical protein
MSLQVHPDFVGEFFWAIPIPPNVPKMRERERDEKWREWRAGVGCYLALRQKKMMVKKIIIFLKK